jgi:predicted DNA-binding transcriptional regulator AlpA
MQTTSTETVTLTITEFCRRYQMSRPFYYELQRTGKGPRELRPGPKKVMISVRAAEEWERQNETPTPAQT